MLGQCIEGVAQRGVVQLAGPHHGEAQLIREHGIQRVVGQGPHPHQDGADASAMRRLIAQPGVQIGLAEQAAFNEKSTKQRRHTASPALVGRGNRLAHQFGAVSAAAGGVTAGGVLVSGTAVVVSGIVRAVPGGGVANPAQLRSDLRKDSVMASASCESLIT